VHCFPLWGINSKQAKCQTDGFVDDKSVASCVAFMSPVSFNIQKSNIFSNPEGLIVEADRAFLAIFDFLVSIVYQGLQPSCSAE
jgi:hypothetical protein